jgi:hypothetical protein
LSKFYGLHPITMPDLLLISTANLRILIKTEGQGAPDGGLAGWKTGFNGRVRIYLFLHDVIATITMSYSVNMKFTVSKSLRMLQLCRF